MVKLDRVRPVRPFLLTCVMLLLAAGRPLAADPVRDRIQPFLKTYCFECHNQEILAGELNLTRYASASQFAEDFRQWELVVSLLKNTEMPPAEAKQPSAVERAEMLLMDRMGLELPQFGDAQERLAGI